MSKWEGMELPLKTGRKDGGRDGEGSVDGG